MGADLKHCRFYSDIGFISDSSREHGLGAQTKGSRGKVGGLSLRLTLGYGFSMMGSRSISPSRFMRLKIRIGLDLRSRPIISRGFYV